MICKLLGHTQIATTQRCAHPAKETTHQAPELIGGAMAAAE
jgi:hypothetical protein